MLVVLAGLSKAIKSGDTDSNAFWAKQGRDAEALSVAILMGIPEAGAISKLEDAWEGHREQFEEDRRKYFIWFLAAFFGLAGEISIIRTSRERVSQIGVERALPWIGSVQRAEDIAATEVTRLYNWGVLRGKEYLGEETKTWYTMSDEFVCDICAPMHGMTIPIDEMFVLNTGEEVETPPAHGRCRCECQ